MMPIFYSASLDTQLTLKTGQHSKMPHPPGATKPTTPHFVLGCNFNGNPKKPHN